MAPRGESPRAVSAFPLLRTVPPLLIAGIVCEESLWPKKTIEVSMEMEREVLRCQVCGLVQYRTRTDNCRSCLRLLPPKVSFVIPSPTPTDLAGGRPPIV